MQGSSRFVVGIHVLTLLAIKQDDRLSSDKLAWSLNTNAVVVRRLLGHLRDAGLVSSRRGPNGGFAIAHPPEDVTLRDVYEAVETESLFVYHPNDPNADCPVGDNIQAVLSDSLEPAETVLKNELRNTTIADITDRVLENTSASLDEL